MENHETECYILQSLELLADLATTPASQYCGPELGRSAQAWAPHGSPLDDVMASPCKSPTQSVFSPLAVKAPCSRWTIPSGILPQSVSIKQLCAEQFEPVTPVR
jgi:hypothetical protein